MDRRWILAFVQGAVCSAPGFAQYATGISNGLPALNLNPALGAHSPYNWQLQLLHGRVHADNTFLQMEWPFSPYQEAMRNPETEPTRWEEYHLSYRLNGRTEKFAASAGLSGPQLMFKEGKWQFGLIHSAEGAARLKGLYEPLAYAGFREFDSAAGAFDLFSERNGGRRETFPRLAMNAHAWAGAGVHVSRLIPLEWNRSLAVGASWRRIWGFGGGSFNSSGMELADVGRNQFIVFPTQNTLHEYRGIGRGQALDLGLVYTFHKKPFRQPGGYNTRHPDYLLRAGIALLDLGSIRYNNHIQHQWNNSEPIYWTTAGWLDRYDAGQINGAEDLGFPNYSRSETPAAIALPTRLSVHADYQLRKNWFLQGQWIQSLRAAYGPHIRHGSWLMLSPRYEKGRFQVSLPAFLEYDYRSFRMGLAFRTGPFYAGTNSLGTWLSPRQRRDAGMYFGILIDNLPRNGDPRGRPHIKRRIPATAQPRQIDAVDCGGL
jgi:hypothetical protein